MTDIAFHFNMPDKLAYACRLLRKAHAAGHTVGVVGQPEMLQALDVALWRFSALDFIPHCGASAPAQVLSASPIVLASDCAALPHTTGGVLVHLGETDAAPEGFERFERLVELVGTDIADRAQARLRWRHYADRGYTIQRHDLAARSNAQ